MDAKSKAAIIVDFFKTMMNNTLDVSYPYSSVENIDEAAKKAALICVDEVMETLSPFMGDSNARKYWEQVKEEINKL